MLKVVAFMKQVAEELRMGGNFGTAHVYRSSTNAIIAYCGEGDFSFDEVTPEWLKGFEIHLRGKGCSWNTVSTYLRTSARTCPAHASRQEVWRKMKAVW